MKGGQQFNNLVASQYYTMDTSINYTYLYNVHGNNATV
jgi:hypothetical protein